MRKAYNFHNLELAWKCLIFAHICVSLCCYNPFIAIFTVVITHRGNFILYLMPYTLRHVWQNQPNDLCTQRSLRSAWASAKTDRRLRCVKDQTFIDVDSEDSDQTESMTKPTKWPVRQAKSQISLAIHPVCVWRTKHLLMRTAKTLTRLRAWQNQQNDLCAQRSLSSAWLSAQSDQRRFWSDWEDAQVDQSLRWAHMQYCWFCHVAAHFLPNPKHSIAHLIISQS